MYPPLLQLLGVHLDALGFEEEPGFHNLDKIRTFVKPTLIIHAEHDHIIPFAEGQALYDACPAPPKRLLKIRGADHNNLFLVGFSEYLAALKTLADLVTRSEAGP